MLVTFHHLCGALPTKHQPRLHSWYSRKGEGRMFLFFVPATMTYSSEGIVVVIKENSLQHIHTLQGTVEQKKIIYVDIKSSVSCFWG